MEMLSTKLGRGRDGISGVGWRWKTSTVGVLLVLLYYCLKLVDLGCGSLTSG